MSVESDAFDDAFRAGMGFVIARLIRKLGTIPPAAIRADLQAGVAALAASVEPGAIHPTRHVVAPDDVPVFLAALDDAVARQANAVLAALAMPAPDTPWVPPDPPPATLGDLDDAFTGGTFHPPPFLRVTVTRDGAPLGMLSLVPFGPTAGWSWRSLMPGARSEAVGGASPLAAVPEGFAGPADAVTLLYPVVPGG